MRRSDQATGKEIAYAKRLGIPDPELIKRSELRELIREADVTKEELAFLNVMFKYMGRPPLPSVKVKIASLLFRDVAPLVDDGVLMDNKWEEAVLLLWRGHHYLITKIHTDKRVNLMEVRLIQRPGGKLPRIRHITRYQVPHHPVTLHSMGATSVEYEME